MKFGYIRVSKDEQNHELQVDALKREGCEKIFTEKISGASKHRPEYEKMLEQLRPGDEVNVWDIDRLGRTTLELIVLIDTWNQKGILFKSISQPLIDTTTPHGEFIFQLFAILSQHERKRLIRRTNAGLEAARARGRVGGRKKGLSPRYEKIAPLVLKAYKDGSTIRDIMQAFSIPSSATVYKILKGRMDLGEHIDLQKL
ncbi:recombinase family protein [Dyadobacter sediminis]|uniref:Recombinase family protein n=1 Tax=Dyadobacter sediminis TaxID=1493691 RepID=A0A5R9K885_9BACT|nr:recombinase family protein [Dyadobacter sediminis]TLU90296.1 recombinase family protein [Dyadobacter sediminis]GGC06641.1 DNA-invertase [Dyadobacter sediminis]